jgi:tetratricopeptide (TPR) repeat protein
LDRYSFKFHWFFLARFTRSHLVLTMMNEAVSQSPATQYPNGLGAAPDRLDSWKEIASYLKREVRTVQLWEKKEGLPVHRHYHNRLGTIYAFRSEIERWGRKVSRRVELAIPLDPAPVKQENERAGDLRIQVSRLECRSSNPQHQALCEVIESKTIAALQQLNPEHLIVAGSEIPFRHEDAGASTESVPLAYLLSWTLQADEGGVTICADVSCSQEGEEGWSSRFSCEQVEAKEIANSIARHIAQCLWLTAISTQPRSPQILRRQRGSSREAYLKGRYFWSQRNEEGLRKAVRWFESAIQEDPEFPLLYSGLADSLNLLSFYEIVSPAEAMPVARRAAFKALELDPALAEAHASLADIMLHFDRDWDGADREYRKAIQCNPGYALGYHWYSNLLAAKGQHEAAQIAIMQALEIDPASPITQVWAGVTSHMAHRYDDAILHYKTAFELKPDFIWAHMYMAQALEQKGEFKEALLEFETTLALANDNNCVKAMKAHALAAAGDRRSARTILRELQDTPANKCMPSFDIAATYAALGESKQTIAWLLRACREGNMKLFTLIQDARFDLLRDMTEFRAVVDHMGLTQYSSSYRPAVF